VGLFLEATMQRQPATFIRTSRGYLNLALVRLIVEEEETVKFIFDDQRGAFISLPKKEGWRVLSTMISELLVCAD
jgi:hypothetical protein